MLVGGEALTADVVAALQEAPAADILNIYRPISTHACIRPATCRDIGPMAPWSSLVASITRSRSASIAWSREKSSTRSRTTPPCGKRWWWHGEETPGDLRLIAYVGGNWGPTPTSSTLRDFLARSLPAAMVPTSFVVLDVLPRTANGKVDRHALPSPDHVRSDRTGPVAAPRTPIGATLVEIWRRVLRVDHVGIEDSFLDLGGNTLSSIQVAFGIRSAFQIELPLEDTLTAPTLRALAGRVEQSLLEEAGDARLAPPLSGVGDVVRRQAVLEEEMRAADPNPVQ